MLQRSSLTACAGSLRPPPPPAHRLPLHPTLAHPFAVTQLAFSPDGRFLASASRDRTVAIFQRREGAAGGDAGGDDAAQPFSLVGRIKAHARIVWGLHWSPDSSLLATASRDGKGETGSPWGRC